MSRSVKLAAAALSLASVASLAVVSLAVALAVAPGDASACTTFRLRSKDGAILVGRSMELGMPLESAVMIVPRGFTLQSTRPDLKTGTTWQAKYGFAGMNTLGHDISTDGINEAGLSVGTLYIPGFVQYQPFPTQAGKPAISNLELSNWLLSNFATVDEVRAALPKVVVYDLTMPPAGPQPLHWAISDARGGAIVVEYVEGALRIHDNPIGTLTNSPNFEWHLTNLREHVNLTNQNVDPLRLGSVEIAPLSQGSGLLGIPGDYTGPARFVRATALAWSTVPPPTAAEGANAAFHVLNAVDIPIGAVAQRIPGKDGAAPTLAYEQTQWATVHDLTNRLLYYRTYGNLAIRKVDLKAIDWTGKAIRHIPMPTGMQAEDVTAQAK
ncbi:MAG: choloylglycine hydrolase family protein [Deltaproteobacteria bacterium]